MTARELAELLDKHATLSYGDGITWEVKILDGRQAYGRFDVLVTPVSGEGETWVSAERVKVRG